MESRRVITSTVGKRIRQIRKAQRKTITEMANKIGLTSSLISQIERGKANASIHTLWSIAEFLKVPIGSFFEPDHRESPVVKLSERKVINVKDGVKFYLLSPNLRGKLECIGAVLEPGGATRDKPYTHQGEEICIVLKGRIEMTLGDEKYILEKDDSISFSSTTPHRAKNIGRAQAITIWVTTPPTF